MSSILQYTKGLWPSRTICTALLPTFKIFSSPFDIDREEVLLQLQMELIDLQCSEDLKSKFLVFHILELYKDYVHPSGQFPNLITHTQQVVSIFGIQYLCERLFFEMKYALSMLYSQLLNHHLSDVLLLSSF